MMRLIVILCTAILCCGCKGQQAKDPAEADLSGCPSCLALETCIALLAYGLLSNDGNDIPLGSACEGIISDSLSMFLQVQKRVFKDWQRNRAYNSDRAYIGWSEPSGNISGDGALLQKLIWTRVHMESGYTKMWDLDAGAAISVFGGDNLFVWRHRMLGHAKDRIVSMTPLCNFDSLIENASFNEAASCFDAHFSEKYPPVTSLSTWCEEVKYAAHELKKFSKDSSFSQDFLLRYYDSRCNAEELSNEELEELLSIENSNKRTEPRDGDAGECPPCSLSEKCIALLAYGLLSNDENDVPFGGTCKDIAPDSLVEYLRLQKRIFKRWEKTKEIDTNDIKLGTAYAGEKGIGLLQTLILNRVRSENNIGNKPRK